MRTNAALLSRRNAAVVRGIGHATPISAARALNSEIWDVEGKRYVDFAGGIGVLNTGHCHPKVMAAVRASGADVEGAGADGRWPPERVDDWRWARRYGPQLYHPPSDEAERCFAG